MKVKKKKVIHIEEEISTLKDINPEIREEYVQKLKKIESGRFYFTRKIER